MQSETLDPVSRTTEIIFGLIMVLSFTCSLSVASSGSTEVREMLIAALGCNVAWGVIDAFFYLMGVAVENSRENLLIKKLKVTGDRGVAKDLFSGLIPASILGSLTLQSFTEIREHLIKNDKPGGAVISTADLKSAFQIFSLVFLTTFPVAIPFMLMENASSALRVSNLIALTLLFGSGYSLGRYAGRHPILWGAGVAIIGAFLVSFTIALGG